MRWLTGCEKEQELFSRLKKIPLTRERQRGRQGSLSERPCLPQQQLDRRVDQQHHDPAREEPDHYALQALYPAQLFYHTARQMPRQQHLSFEFPPHADTPQGVVAG